MIQQRVINVSDLKPLDHLMELNYPMFPGYMETMINEGMYVVSNGERLLSREEAINELKRDDKK